jgi:hypothetical protein
VLLACSSNKTEHFTNSRRTKEAVSNDQGSNKCIKFTLEIPSIKFYEIPSIKFYEIPSITFCEIPSIKFYEIPSTKF